MSKWGLIGLAWGDVMASLAVAKTKGIQNIIYIGPYPEIATFIEHQDFISKVEYRNYSFKDRYDFMKYFTRMANQFDIKELTLDQSQVRINDINPRSTLRVLKLS